MSSINYDLTKIKCFIFDVDGVLSPNSIPLSPEGEPMRMVNIKDGFALNMACKKGYGVAIITGGATKAVKKRFEDLGVKHIYMKASIKIDAYNDFIGKTGYQPEEIIYVGDDLPDYHVMQLVGLPVAPADAAPEIKQTAKYISRKKGGDGLARDVIEQVLKTQRNWFCEEAFGW